MFRRGRSYSITLQPSRTGSTIIETREVDSTYSILHDTRPRARHHPTPVTMRGLEAMEHDSPQPTRTIPFISHTEPAYSTVQDTHYPLITKHSPALQKGPDSDSTNSAIPFYSTVNKIKTHPPTPDTPAQNHSAFPTPETTSPDAPATQVYSTINKVKNTFSSTPDISRNIQSHVTDKVYS